MAQAIAGGAIERGVIDASQVIASDPSDTHRQIFADWGCATTPDNKAVAAQAKQVVLAVKPQIFPQVAPDLALGDDAQVLISIMAGLSSKKINGLIGKERRVVRVMPNTPALVGAGMAGVARCGTAKPGDDDLAKQLFAAVGQVIELTEPEIDAINAVSGSGPGYLFYFAEAMEQAATELGLGDNARRIVAQTFFGSGKLMLETGEDPAELRRKVSSPGGTTQAACESMDDANVKQAITAAMRVAFEKAQELGR